MPFDSISLRFYLHCNINNRSAVGSTTRLVQKLPVGNGTLSNDDDDDDDDSFFIPFPRRDGENKDGSIIEEAGIGFFPKVDRSTCGNGTCSTLVVEEV